MKKSSFLHNPKDMLSKGFKAAKCKTSLKLASSRLKLLKNKKEVQLKQMKRELAQLLDAGQDQTARIRVEHVIREEKMMAAYDLIEIYCELIVARLPIIETQKNCPIDLKEAITSVIFASPRCGDIPELLDIRKHFTAKYGKEFTSAAIELRPACGVSRLLIEKLSAKAPDLQIKIKTLTAIAEEHNIKWDPEAFGESETMPNDLLNGPSTFHNVNKMDAEATHLVPDIQNLPSHNRMHDQPVTSAEQNVRSTQNLPTQFSGLSNVISSISHLERRPSGSRTDGAEIKHEFHGNDDAFSFGQQSWNMDFKDATAAAQAAAESAERASMAARAAAQLSSRGRISRQHSNESHKSDFYARRDEGARKSDLTVDHLKDSADVSFAERHPRVPPNVHNTESEIPSQDDHDSEIRSAQTFSLRSERPLNKDPSVRNAQGADEYSEKILFKEEEMEADMETSSDKSEAEPGKHLTEGFSSVKFDYYGEERVEKQPSITSFHSNVSGGDDNHDFGNDHPVGFGEHMGRDYLQSGSHDSGAVVFDESGSDDEDFGFNTSSHHEEFYVPSPDRNVAAHQSADTGNFGPVAFDDSDGHSSEDESDMGHSWLRGTKDSGNLDGKEKLSLGSARSSFSKRHWKSDQRTETTIGSPPPTHSSPRWEKSRSNDSDSKRVYGNSVDEVNRHNSSQTKFSLVDEVNDNITSSHSHGSDDDNSIYGKELNFGKLTGGFRHKGYTLPPYTRNQLDNMTPSARKGGEEIPTVIRESIAASAAGSSPTGSSSAFDNERRSTVPDSHFASDSDSSEEEIEKQPSARGQEPYVQTTEKDVKAKSNSRRPVTYFHSESSDSEDDSAKHVFTGRNRFGTGVSRRTKASPSTGSISHLKGRAGSVVLETSEETETDKKHSRPIREMQPSSSDKVAFSFKKTLDSKRSLEDKNRESYRAEQPSNSKQTSGSAETKKMSSWNREDSRKKDREDSRKKDNSNVHSEQNLEASVNTEPQKTASGKSIDRKDSGKKASHVHPNLPDYDTFLARFQALQRNNQ